MKGLALGLALAFAIVACGGQQLPADWEVRQHKMDELTALWSQIRQWRHESHMALDPAPRDVFQWGPRSPQEVERVCPAYHEVPTKCGDVCSLGDDICDNAERICTLADELGKDDVDAQDKCHSAKASCREAKQRCCDCAATEGATP
ncbi:MAG TPA: hypothetical protein VGM88_34955 [Kofleriaceae bacterium]